MFMAKAHSPSFSDILSMGSMILAILAFASLATVFMVRPELLGIAAEKPKYDPLTFNLKDAEEICHAQSRKTFGKASTFLQQDHFSTRFDQPRGLFLVFYRANFPQSETYWHGRYPKEAYIECHVNKHQKVKQYGTTKEQNS